MRPRLSRPFLLLAVLVAGCGSAESGPAPARPQQVGLGWRQACDAPRVRIRAYFSRLAVGPHSWAVYASIANTGRTRVSVTRPLELRGGLPGRTFFGLKAFRTASKSEVEREAARLGLKPPLVAARFRPPFPHVLLPGARWRGSFSGSGDLPRGEPIRIVLGRFEVYAPYGGYLCVSDRVLRLR